MRGLLDPLEGGQISAPSGRTPTCGSVAWRRARRGASPEPPMATAPMIPGRGTMRGDLPARRAAARGEAGTALASTRVTPRRARAASRAPGRAALLLPTVSRARPRLRRAPGRRAGGRGRLTMQVGAWRAVATTGGRGACAAGIGNDAQHGHALHARSAGEVRIVGQHGAEPTRMASGRARIAWASRRARACDPAGFAGGGGDAAISSAGGSASRWAGPARCGEEAGIEGTGLGSQQPSSTTMQASRSRVRPRPFTRGSGSRMATTTRATPAAASASQQGGVRP